uniref:Replication-associated protein n=1 Tax=Ficedula mugimaki CRESS-DNA-virus sp. TaxID=2815035 RepID=A0A8A4XB92_9VIRU|nr:MAG: replication-associated protein [Ficedula mugimaki CRESS-DNA-virus sp.]
MSGVASTGSKAKRWIFTSFNVDNEPAFDETVHEYLCFGRETCPDTNRKHLQGCVVFKNRRTLVQIKKWIPTAHFERARGTPEEFSNYCKKDGDFSEFGVLPSSTGRADKFGDILRKAEAGEIAEIKEAYPGMYLRYKATILSSLKCDVTELDGSCGVWINGPPRSGKDYAVRQLDSVYNKMLNKWWCGYRNEKYVLISDVEPHHAPWLGYYLKIWCDRYPFTAEIKGGSMLIRPRKVFITSNFTIESVFAGEILGALQARMNIYDYSGSDVVISKRLVLTPPDTFKRLLALHEDGILFPPPASTSTETSATNPEEERETPEGEPPPKKVKPHNPELC